MHDSTVSSSFLDPTDDATSGRRRWLLLTHHIPPEPAYFRVKVGRKLKRLGAVALKNSVYAVPFSDEAAEDFLWLAQEIEREGGEATVSRASFLDARSDDRLIRQFRAARDADYQEVRDAAHALREEAATGSDHGPAGGHGAKGKLERLVRRLEEVKEVDYFDAEGRAAAERAVAEVEAAHAGPKAATPNVDPPPDDAFRGRTWVTRKGVKVDRIASAWLIRRFIDPDARFAFVDPHGHQPAEDEVRFDMFEGEFTHEGDACTFEVLLTRFGLREPGLTALGQIVHDLDCKDDKFGRAEVAGVASFIDGIVRSRDDDLSRLERGATLLDDLYQHFQASPA